MPLFEAEYKKLNSRQREAVDYIDGPLLVVAGPGTGKTQLLSMRVANILQKTDTDAGSILCLTFTNKAALNMHERLLSLTGNDAQHVMIKTFHSFAAELMNMYPDYFWNGARLSTAPDTIQLELIQGILSKLPLDNPLALKFAGQFTAGSDVKKGLRLVKEAGLTPDKLRAIIAANLAYIDIIEPQLADILAAPLSIKKLDDLQAKINELPEQGIDESLAPLTSLSQVIKESLAFAIESDQVSGKTIQTGKWKKRFIQTVEGVKGMFDERKKNAWWQSLAGVYEQYRDQLHARGYYDYSDMVVEVISQLENNPEVRASVQERFLYVLIDEFQDTNAAQLRLAHIIADHHAQNGKPNLMAVGDDDQSIYKFNGAELGNMLSFQRTYPATKLIVLGDNYRSTQAILDASAKIISHAADRLVLREKTITKNLVAKNPPASAGVLEHRVFSTQEQQTDAIAGDVANAYKAGNHSVAVLARGHASLQRVAGLLLQLDIPVAYEAQNNILDHQAIKQVYAVANTLLAIQRGDTAGASAFLADTLRHPMWGLQPQLLWTIAKDNYKSNDWLEYILARNEPELQNIGQWLTWLAQQSASEPLEITIEYILGLRSGQHMTSPLREYFMGEKAIDTNYLRAISAIRVLLALVKEFSRLPNASLSDFVEFMRVSIESGEIIADESAFVSGENAVELLTVHKAKGLEFDTVYIIDATDNNWRPTAGGRKPPANLPLQPPGDDMDDYARLLFVAATRAKRTLIAASYTQDVNGKETLPTPLLHDVLPLTKVADKKEAELVRTIERHLAWPELNTRDAKLCLQDQLASYSLSATGLLDFLDVTKGGPDYFLQRHLLRLPQAKSAQMAFGIAIHGALELAQILTNKGAFSLSATQKRFANMLADQDLPSHEYERYLPHGTELLSKLLGSETFWLPKHALPEQKITGVRIGDATINGTLDRIDQTKDSCTVVDYKTGAPLGSFFTKDQTKAIKAWRHRSQLIFYSLLLARSGRLKSKNISGQMIYLEATTARELVREYTATTDDLARMGQLIEAAYSRIKNFDLPDTSHYPATHEGIVRFEQDLLEGKI